VDSVHYMMPLFGTDGIRSQEVGELLSTPLALQSGLPGQVKVNKIWHAGTSNCGTGLQRYVGNDSLFRTYSSWVRSLVSGVVSTPCVAYLTSISKAVGR